MVTGGPATSLEPAAPLDPAASLAPTREKNTGLNSSVSNWSSSQGAHEVAVRQAAPLGRGPVDRYIWVTWSNPFVRRFVGYCGSFLNFAKDFLVKRSQASVRRACLGWPGAKLNDAQVFVNVALYSRYDATARCLPPARTAPFYSPVLESCCAPLQRTNALGDTAEELRF